ncbi:MAG: PH domain-containing protein [Propionibacteriaceae bacterium]|jgi:putative membrane protein|nr:PH domain-containing protein [Propionibacteriaceae bacterium]
MIPQEPLAADRDWQRLHPLTPWLRGWLVIVAIIGFMINSMRDNFREALEFGRATGIWAIVLAVLGIVAIATTYNFIWWRMARFRVGSESVELNTGIISRRHRSLRLDQLEAIDIVRPVVARIFGLAELKLESAGGLDSHLSLAYLTATHAEAVRAEILSRKTISSTPAHQDPTENAHLFQVPPSWTIQSYLRTWEPWFTLAAIIATIAFSLYFETWTGLIGLLPFFYGLVRVFWKHVITEMGFTGYVHPDGVHLTHGLLTRVNQSIPANRIQAVRLRQRLWWRKPNWWRIDLNVAGYGLQAETRTLLVPVADPTMASLAVASIMPEATKPEVWEVIDAVMHGAISGPGFVKSSPKARLFDPVAWQHQGYTSTPYALIIRNGRFTRRVTIVPHNRIQGINVSAGLLQRRRELASVVLYSTQGPIAPYLPHLDNSDVQDLLNNETPLIVQPQT